MKSFKKFVLETTEVNEAKVEDHHYALINTKVNRRVGHGTVFKTEAGAKHYHESQKKFSKDADAYKADHMKVMSVGDAKKSGVPEHNFSNLAVSEEVELDEDTMPSNVASRLSDSHFTTAFNHKKAGNMKGYAAHLKVANRIEDAIIRAGSHMPIKSKQIEAASDKAFKDHPHRATKTEEVELDENIKGWKNAASDISKMRSAQGKTVKLVSLKKDGNESKMHDATKTFRSEDEAQEHHDRVTKLNPKSKIRHNLYVDGKQVKTLG